jgi:membrane-associated HD superfamily phosphohydrolase
MYPQSASLARAMKTLYALGNEPRAPRASAHAAGEAFDEGAATGQSVFNAAKNRKRMMQLENAKAQLKLDKQDREEYGSNMKSFQDHENYVKSELSPEQQQQYALSSGSGLGDRSYGDLYGQAMHQDYMKQLGNHLQSQIGVHSAAETTPIAGVNTAKGQAELSNYAKVNGTDQAQARGLVRQGMGMSQIGINPEVGY